MHSTQAPQPLRTVPQQHSFLPHVAGLRGLAILLVVWFHISQGNTSLQPSASLPYGYFGVDVFFVIMGYFLLSSFANGKIEALSWRSTVKFAKGKLYRLWPPLAILIIAGSILSLFFLDCDQLRHMARTARYALRGTANSFLDRSTAGYFAEESGMNPFLHTWFLSVTIQFFLIGWVGYQLWKLCQQYVSHVLANVLLWSVGLCSFAVSIAPSFLLILNHYGFNTDIPNISYYSTFPRLWTLLAGGIVLILPNRESRTKGILLGLLGICCIIIPATQHHELARYLSPVVVLGTVLTIRYLPGSALVKVLDNPIMRWLGGISFSLYLVHMPILVAYKGATFQHPDLFGGILILGISIIAGWLMMFVAEKPRWAFWGCLTFCTLAWVTSSLIYKTKGLRKYWNAEANTLELPAYERELLSYPDGADIWRSFDKANIRADEGWQLCAYNRISPKIICELIALGTPDVQPSFVVMGDSHAQHLMSGLDYHARKSGISGCQITGIIVPFWDRLINRPGSPSYYYNRDKAEGVIRWLEAHPELKTVIIGQFWAHFNRMTADWNHRPLDCSTLQSNETALREFLERLRATGKQVYLIEPLPLFLSKNMLAYARYQKRVHFNIKSEAFYCTEEAHIQKFGEVIRLLRSLEQEGLCKLINPSPIFFEKGTAHALHNGKIRYRDDGHLSVDGSKQLGELILRSIQ